MTTELTKAAQQALEVLKSATSFMSRKARDQHPKTVARLERALTQRPAAQTERDDDDGDVTGQPGPLPETGWDEVPAGAFRKPSPTAGMNLGERIKHVGGRENAAGYIEFGSVAAVRALVRQYLRDLPAPQQATPEPVGEPYGWAVTGCHSLYRGEWAEATARGEAKRCGGTARAVALYARPAPGVPEPVGEPAFWVLTKQLQQRETTTRGYMWFSNPQNDSWTPLYTRPAPGVPERIEPQDWFESSEQKNTETAYCNGWNDCRDRMLAAAQAKGGEHD